MKYFHPKTLNISYSTLYFKRIYIFTIFHQIFSQTFLSNLSQICLVPFPILKRYTWSCLITSYYIFLSDNLLLCSRLIERNRSLDVLTCGVLLPGQFSHTTNYLRCLVRNSLHLKLFFKKKSVLIKEILSQIAISCWKISISLTN